MAIGEESEVANAMEAVGQGVEQEASDELVGRQAHDLDGAAVAIVLPGEGDMIVIAGSDAAVGDGDAMGVAAEIGENLRRSAERLLGVDDPIDAPHGGQMGGERDGIGQMREIAEEAEALGVEGGLQAFEEQATEQAGERLDGQKEVRRVPRSIGRRRAESPPPGTTQWTCGWCVSVCPQVCRTARTPIFAPSRRGLAASVVIASTALANSIA